MGMKKATGKETLQVALINKVMQLCGKVGDEKTTVPEHRGFSLQG
jgi:hypothetical protein